MGNTLSKVEREGFADKVQSMMKSGITTATKIHQILKDEYDANLSVSSVTRYVAKIKDTIAGDSFKTIRDHVDSVVPEDLKALEAMEKQCLDWAKEDPGEMAERLAATAILVDSEVNDWVDLILSVPGAKDRIVKIKRIVRKVAGYILKDARLQNKRIQAMNTAVKIITLKLQQAGLLDDEGKGKIIIVDRSSDYNEAADEPGFVSIPYIVKANIPETKGEKPDGP